ncbi:unnamed protein product [Ostreobium quekettii]|uniref:Ubiquitin-like domain-containing protein n=1 Tax=Ostreobium quekettii TaxID=121088 RepID=A0A8S1IVU2_9CHLO|nr:unnamed protein product [Ostreobium quekettii]|eukprot:evm.model.scf_2001.3 EVM.evm.TU.scf_2001.3   scf_2001:25757-29002(+)
MPDDLFQLTIRSKAHTDKTFTVRKTNTIYDIKWKFQNPTGVKTWDQRLYYTPPGTHARRIPLGIGGWRVDVGDRTTKGDPPGPGANWVGIIGARPKPPANGMPTHHADAIQFAASPMDNIFELMDQHGYMPPKWLRRTVEPGWEGVDLPACLKVTPVVAKTKKVKVLPAGAAATCDVDGGDLGLPVDGATFVEFYNDVVDAIKGVEREEKMTKTRLAGRAGDRIEFPCGLVVDFRVARRMEGEEELLGSHGRFAMLRVEDFEGRVPRAWKRRGGMFFGMRRRERMWVGLEAEAERPVAVKVAVGGVNVITGQPWEEGLSNKPQNYIVCDPRGYIDGFAVGEGGIRQFKAMETMKKYSQNGELLKNIGSAAIRLEAYPVMRTDVLVSRDHLRPFESPINETQTPAEAGLTPGDVFYMTSHEFGMRPSTLVDFVDTDTCDYLLLEDASQMERYMRLADYGIDRDCVIELINKQGHCRNESKVDCDRPRTMKRVQQRFRDRVGRAFWDTRHPECAFVSMLNTMQYKAIAGREPPPTRLVGPMHNGRPHFDGLDEVVLPDAQVAQFLPELEGDAMLECVADVKEEDRPLLERNLCNQCVVHACCNDLSPCRHKLCAECTGVLAQANAMCKMCHQNVVGVRRWSRAFVKADDIMRREASAVVCLHMNCPWEVCGQ